MSNNSDKENKTQEEEQEIKKNYNLFYISLGCFGVGLILLVLTIVFTFVLKNGIAIYFLVSSMICELASISFLNGQKQKFGREKRESVFVILSYVVMGVALIIFLTGMSANIIA